MKKKIIAALVALTSASSVCATTTDNVSVYGAIEVGGYFDEQSTNNMGYTTDTNASIGLAYDDGTFIGAVEVDGAIMEGVTGFGAVLDKAWVGAKESVGVFDVTVKVGLHDSVFDNHSGLGDLAVEFGNGANETNAGGDIDGVSIELTDGAFYAGATLVADQNVDLESWNTAIEYNTGNVTFGGAFSKTDGTFFLLTGHEDSTAWNVGIEFKDGIFGFGIMHNEFDDAIDSSNDVDNTQISMSLDLPADVTVAASSTYVYLPDTDDTEYKTTIGAVWAATSEVALLVEVEHNYDTDETQGFAKVIMEF